MRKSRKITSGFINLIFFINNGKAFLKRWLFKSKICFLLILGFKGPLELININEQLNNLLSKFSIKLRVTFSAPPPAKEGKIIKIEIFFIKYFFKKLLIKYI